MDTHPKPDLYTVEDVDTGIGVNYNTENEVTAVVKKHVNPCQLSISVWEGEYIVEQYTGEDWIEDFDKASPMTEYEIICRQIEDVKTQTAKLNKFSLTSGARRQGATREIVNCLVDTLDTLFERRKQAKFEGQIKIPDEVHTVDIFLKQVPAVATYDSEGVYIDHFYDVHAWVIACEGAQWHMFDGHGVRSFYRPKK